MVARRGAYRVLVVNLRERDHLEDLVLRWEYNIKIDFREISLGTWTLLIWLRTGRSDGLL